MTTAAPTVVTIFPLTSATTRPITRTGWASRTRKSSSIPIEMKNRLLKLSRKGKISAIAWWLYSDSEMISPAMNAPSARDRPANELSQAMPRHTKMMVITNSSRLRLRTTSTSRRGTRYHAATRISSTARIALATDHTTVRSPASPSPPNTGVTTIIGTTARSCTIKIPMISRPCGELVSPRSVTILSATAVLLIAARKPQNTLWLSGRPKALAASADKPIADPIWRSPAPATVRSDRSWPRENSTPMVNSNSTTPTSAKTSTRATLSTTSSPYGPSSAPATRKPTTAGSRSLLNPYTTTIEAPKSTTRSRRKCSSVMKDALERDGASYIHGRLRTNKEDCRADDGEAGETGRRSEAHHTRA